MVLCITDKIYLIIVQWDATLSSLFIIPQVHPTCFRCQPHPPSGVHKTVTTASGTGHILYCCYLMCICCTMCVLLFFTLDAGLLARSQYSEGPATGHLDTGFSWFLCVYKQMLRWFPRFQVAIKCFSCSPPDLNLLVTNFIFRIHVK